MRVNRKILVCGGRDYSNYAVVKSVLDEIAPLLIIDGVARGADSLGNRYATKNTIPNMRFPANWGNLGNAAGPIRNSWMLQFGMPDLVIAFPGGTGTADMVKQANVCGIEVKLITEGE